MKIKSITLANMIAASAIATVIFGAGPLVQAQSYSWDPSHTPATGSDGPGTWDNATANWTNNGVDVTWPTDNNAAIAWFGTSANTTANIAVTVNRSPNGVTNNQIEFRDMGNYGCYNIGGSGASGTINIDPANFFSIYTGAGGTNTVSAPIAGTLNSGKAVIIGRPASTYGKLILSGANTFVPGGGPGISIRQGTLYVSSLNTYTSVTNNNGGTSVNQPSSNLGATSATTANNAISLCYNGYGTGSLIYTGAGEGTDRGLQVGAGTGAAGNGIIENDGSGPLVFAGPFTTYLGSASVNKTLTLQGSNTGLNEIKSMLADASSPPSTTNLLGVVKAGAGTWVLSGNNTYNGGTSITAGTLKITNDFNLGAVPGSPTAGNLVVNNATLYLSGASGGSITISANRGIYLGGNSGSASGFIQIDPGVTVNYGGIMANNPGGTGSLYLLQTPTGGTLVLSGASTFTGGVINRATTLSVSSINCVNTVVNSALPGGQSTHQSSSNLGAPTSTSTGLIELGYNGYSGTLIYTGSGEGTDRNFNLGNNTSGGGGGGGTMENDGTGPLVFTGIFTAGAASATTSNNKTLTLQGSNTGANQFATVISDGAVNGSYTAVTSLTKAGVGTWELTAANTYSGATTISGGTLLLGSGGAIGASTTTVSSGATLGSATTAATTIGAATTYSLGGLASFTATGGASTSVGQISVTGNLALNANAVTINVSGASLAPGAYRLLSCSGTLTGSANSTPTIAGTALASGYTASVTTTTGAGGHVDLIVNATPVFTGLTASPSITYGAMSVSLSGTVSSTSGPATVYAANGDTVTATINGHAVSGTVSGSSGAFTITYNDSSLHSDYINSYTINYAYAGNSSVYLNSAANNTSTSLTVNKAPVTITGVTAASKTYDGTSTAVLSGGTVSGTFNSDNVTFTTGTGTFSNQNVGTWSVTASGYVLSATGVSTNYSLSAQPGVPNASITPKALTVTGLSVPASKVYDGTLTAAVSGSAGVNTEAPTFNTGGDGKAYTGDTVLPLGTATGTYNLATVDGATTVTFNGLSTANGNYTLNPLTQAATITPKALTVTGITAPSTVYDGTTTAKLGGAAAFPAPEAAGAGTTSDGMPYSVDSVSPGTVTGTLAAKDVGSEAVTTVVTVTGAGFGNYTVTSQAGLTQPVTAKPLNYSGISAANRAYDGTTVASLSGAATTLTAETAGSGSTSDGMPYTGDVVSFTTGTLTGTFATNQAGTGIAVTVTGGVSLTPGGQSGNYLVGLPSPALTASILQATPSIGASSSESPAGYRDSIYFTATLPSDATGSVVFSSTNGPISTNGVSAGLATSLSITNLPRGTNVITVAYLGDDNYLGSSTNLNQIVTNHPPAASVMTVTCPEGLSLLVALSELATNWSDVDGDTVELNGINVTTTNGVVLYPVNLTTNLDGSYVITNIAYLYYINPTNAMNDQFSYAISDGQGGTNIGYVNIVISTNAVTGQATGIIYTGGSAVTVNFAGIIGYSYSVQRSTNLVDWVSIWTTNTPAGGLFNYTDSYVDLGGIAPGAAYYRLAWVP